MVSWSDTIEEAEKMDIKLLSETRITLERLHGIDAEVLHISNAFDTIDCQVLENFGRKVFNIHKNVDLKSKTRLREYVTLRYLVMFADHIINKQSLRLCADRYNRDHATASNCKKTFPNIITNHYDIFHSKVKSVYEEFGLFDKLRDYCLKNS